MMDDDDGQSGQSPRWRRRRKPDHEPDDMPDDEHEPEAGPGGRRGNRSPRLSLSENQELVFSEDDVEAAATVNPDWRRDRKRGRGKQKKGIAFSSSPQELQIWMQQGGWRFVALGAVLVIVLLVGVLSWRRSASRQADGVAPSGTPSMLLPTVAQPSTDEGGGPAAPADGDANTAAPGEPPAPPTAPPPADTSGGEAFVVVGTGSLGLRLRADHATGSAVLATLPEGTRVQKIGDDFVGPNFVWRRVRDPEGREGWVAVDWLQPAP